MEKAESGLKMVVGFRARQAGTPVNAVRSKIESTIPKVLTAARGRRSGTVGPMPRATSLLGRAASVGASIYRSFCSTPGSS